MIDLKIYVPVIGNRFYRTVHRGSGIVGLPTERETIQVDFEDNGINMYDHAAWEDRIAIAAARLSRGYARAWSNQSELMEIGRFRCQSNLRKREFSITDQDALSDWLTSSVIPSSFSIAGSNEKELRLKYYSEPKEVLASQLSEDTWMLKKLWHSGDWIVNADGRVSVLTNEEFKLQYRSLGELKAMLDTDVVSPPVRSQTYARVTAILKGGPLTTEQILAALIDLNPRSLQNLLYKGKTLKLWKVKAGRYYVRPSTG